MSLSALVLIPASPRAIAVPVDVAARVEAIVRRRATVAALVATVGWTVPATAGLLTLLCGVPLMGVAVAMTVSVGATAVAATAARAYGMRSLIRDAPGDARAIVDVVMGTDAGSVDSDVRAALIAHGVDVNRSARSA